MEEYISFFLENIKAVCEDSGMGNSVLVAEDGRVIIEPKYKYPEQINYLLANLNRRGFGGRAVQDGQHLIEVVAPIFTGYLSDVEKMNLLFKNGNKDTKPYKSISLFTGIGGMDIGMAAANLLPVVSNEINQNLAGIHKSCVGKYISRRMYHNGIVAPIEKIIFSDYRGEIDFVFGGPPCQPFSNMGKRENMNDPRAVMLSHFIRCIEEIKPRAFIMENVEGLKPHLPHLTNEFHRVGYAIKWSVINAAKLGVPQNRKRVIVFGCPIDGGDEQKFSFPEAVHHKTSCLEAFSSMSGDGQQSPAHSADVTCRYDSLDFGERDASWVRKIKPGGQSHTILSGGFSSRKPGQPNSPVHWLEPRELSPRECARVSSFPDDFGLEHNGTTIWARRGIGNAVPPLMAYKIGLAVYKYLQSMEEHER